MRRLKIPQQGVTLVEVIVTLVIVAVVLVIISVVMAFLFGSSVPPSQVPGAENVCFSYCAGFVEFQCGDNQIMGLCAGFWDCASETGAHACR